VFENIPPGVYYVVGVHDAVASEWSNPTVLEQLVSAASRVTIAEGDNKTVAVRRSVAK
jgi:hypothetical protein